MDKFISTVDDAKTDTLESQLAKYEQKLERMHLECEYIWYNLIKRKKFVGQNGECHDYVDAKLAEIRSQLCPKQ